MGELLETPAQAIVFLVVGGFLDVVPPNHSRIAVFGVAFPFYEVDLGRVFSLGLCTQEP